MKIHPQFDERDTIFAREDLVAGTPEYEEMYRRHPDMQGIDDYIRSLPGFGSRIPYCDWAMLESNGSILQHLGNPDFVDGHPADKKVKISRERATEKIKNFARWLGADLVGISEVKQDYVYSHRGRIQYSEEPWGEPIRLDHKYAISMGFHENIEMVRTGPHHGEVLESLIVYQRTAVASVILANYIRLMGYPARAHHFTNYQIQSVPLAVEAGLGELGRCGFLLTKEYGNSIRLSTVTTDIPLVTDSPVDIGVQDFCTMCKICAEACPSKAIPLGDKIEIRGVMKWKLATLKCIEYWNKIGTDCGICIGCCPWSQPESWYHRLASEASSRSHVARLLLLWLYPVLYGKYKATPNPDWLDPRMKKSD
ncbi:MAG: reductive dehalogenase [Candidatus Electryoneaceae bacterium]|nr:reductive dehalogenase [Candidatus Electryoneaceae bacterium]